MSASRDFCFLCGSSLAGRVARLLDVLVQQEFERYAWACLPCAAELEPDREGVVHVRRRDVKVRLSRRAGSEADKVKVVYRGA